MAKAADKLSDAVVRKLRAPEKGNRIVYDSGDNRITGFGIRITMAGARSFVLNYRIAGKERRLTIGEFPLWSTSKAREEAKRLRQLVDQGIDPMISRHPETDGLFKARAEIFLQVGRRKRGLPLREATKKEYKRALLTYAADLHNKPLAEIRRGEIAGVIQRVARERGETSAMRCRAALSRLYSWAIANGHAETNPVTGTEGFETPKRNRVLTAAEIRAIWSATEAPADFNLLVRLCLWTGARRAEPGGMAESELDGAVWTVPGQRTKNARPLVLPLPRQAVAALAAWPRTEGRDLLFGRARNNGFQGWSDAKERLDARIARANAERRVGRPLKTREKPAKEDSLPKWDLHDLRRTVQTRMAGLRIPKEIVNRVLNHATGPITEAYDLHDYLAEKADALQSWADALDRIVGGGGEGGKVVPLRRAG